MAMTFAFYRLNVDFTETSGKSVRRTYKLNPAVVTDDTIAEDTATTILAELVLLTNSVINSMQLSRVYFDTNALPASAENSNQALITAKLTGKPNQSGVISIPAAKDGIFVAATGKGHDVVDVADTDLADFLGDFLPGGEIVISDGDTAVAGTFSGVRRNTHSIGT